MQNVVTTGDKAVGVGFGQGSGLSPFSFSVMMDRLACEIRQEWTLMFADDMGSIRSIWRTWRGGGMYWREDE